jgi:hypothetical protein
MPPIPVMPTDTFVSCAKVERAEATKTNAANKSALTIHHAYARRRGGQSLQHQIDTAAFSGTVRRLCVTTFEFHFVSSISPRFSCAVAETRQLRTDVVVPSGGSSRAVTVRPAGLGGYGDEPAPTSVVLFPDFGFARRMFDCRHGAGQP